MRNKEYFRNKKVLVVGLARSGLCAANLLYDLGASVAVTDSRDDESTRQNSRKLKSPEIKVELGRHTKEFVKGNDFIVISPGVTQLAPPVIWAKEEKIALINEIELAWILCPATVIAVTGSNGKTTVTTLIGNILKEKGKNVFICGNIGKPFSGEVSKMKEGDFICLEISSFQLESIKDFKPKIALIINFSRNHLDRHKDMQEYLDAKKRIFMNQDASDVLVLNGDDPVLKKAAKQAKSKVVYFYRKESLNPNQSAVLAVGNILGIDEKRCLNVFKEFKGVEHRQEFVAEINNVHFINDSKATTVESAVWALESINSPILLIAGGRDKGLDYGGILGSARERVREVILIGEAREKIKNALGKELSVNEATSLEEAVSIAFNKARPGDTVLLSPMCSSFDMFKDYEDRGRRFKEIVAKLAKEVK